MIAQVTAQSSEWVGIAAAIAAFGAAVVAIMNAYGQRQIKKVVDTVEVNTNSKLTNVEAEAKGLRDEVKAIHAKLEIMSERLMAEKDRKIPADGATGQATPLEPAPIAVQVVSSHDEPVITKPVTTD